MYTDRKILEIAKDAAFGTVALRYDQEIVDFISMLSEMRPRLEPADYGLMMAGLKRLLAASAAQISKRDLESFQID